MACSRVFTGHVTSDVVCQSDVKRNLETLDSLSRINIFRLGDSIEQKQTAGRQ